jgi:hypothetical protein
MAASDLAERLRDAALIFERDYDRLSMRDAREARTRARVADGWVVEFSRWPETSPSQEERGRAIDALLTLQRECEEWLLERRVPRPPRP